MAIIYKDFAAGLAGLNNRIPAQAVPVPGGRAYIVNGKPYFDQIHFRSDEESPYAHRDIQFHLKRQGDLHGRVYAGAAGEANLTYVAVTEAPAAVFYDINPWQKIFWENLFEVLAACPEPEDFMEAMQGFAKNLYFRLRHDFNLQAIRTDHPRIHMTSPDPADHAVSVEAQRRQARAINTILLQRETDPEEEARIQEPAYPKDVDGFSSPFRNMSYGQFSEWFSGQGGGMEIDWLRNPALYRHLHLLAKHRAMGAVTLDICDTESCEQLAGYLQDVRYAPFETDGEESCARPAAQGARVGLLYTSNICHYLSWSEEESLEIQRTGRQELDFTKRAVTSSVWTRTLDNLRSLVREDALILRFDKASGAPDFPVFLPVFPCRTRDVHIPTALEKGGLVPDTL